MQPLSASASQCCEHARSRSVGPSDEWVVRCRWKLNEGTSSNAIHHVAAAAAPGGVRIFAPLRRTPSGERAGLGRRRPGFKSQPRRCRINSLRQTVHTHRASVHQAAKLVAALLIVAGVAAGLEESNGSLPPGL